MRILISNPDATPPYVCLAIIASTPLCARDLDRWPHDLETLIPNKFISRLYSKYLFKFWFKSIRPFRIRRIICVFCYRTWRTVELRFVERVQWYAIRPTYGYLSSRTASPLFSQYKSHRLLTKKAHVCECEQLAHSHYVKLKCNGPASNPQTSGRKLLTTIGLPLYVYKNTTTEEKYMHSDMFTRNCIR